MQIHIHTLDFKIKKDGLDGSTGAIVRIQFDISGQFWNIRQPQWETMLDWRGMSLEVTAKKLPALGYNVILAPHQASGVEHKATVKASGALIYSTIQYLKCRASTRPMEAPVSHCNRAPATAEVTSPVPEGLPPGRLDGARIVNETGESMKYWVTRGASDTCHPAAPKTVPRGTVAAQGEVAYSTSYPEVKTAAPSGAPSLELLSKNHPTVRTWHCFHCAKTATRPVFALIDVVLCTNRCCREDCHSAVVYTTDVWLL